MVLILKIMIHKLQILQNFNLTFFKRYNLSTVHCWKELSRDDTKMTRKRIYITLDVLLTLHTI